MDLNKPIVRSSFSIKLEKEFLLDIEIIVKAGCSKANLNYEEALFFGLWYGKYKGTALKMDRIENHLPSKIRKLNLNWAECMALAIQCAAWSKNKIENETKREISQKKPSKNLIKKDGFRCGYTEKSKQKNRFVGGTNKDGEPHGKGTETCTDGDKYVGEWKDGKKHGKGTYDYASGGKYVGKWKNDKYHGKGTETFTDETKYIGEYKDGKYHGKGTETFADGTKYVGEWKDGNYHGKGTYTYVSGGKYVGKWKNDKYHGKGTLTQADGNVQTGVWEGGKLIEGHEEKETIKLET
jgi:hypothetical protein